MPFLVRMAGSAHARVLALVCLLAVGLVQVAVAAAGADDREQRGESSYVEVPRIEDLPPDQRPDPRREPGFEQRLQRAEQETRERQERRESAGERSARAGSRLAFRGRGRAAALRVAREAHPMLMDRPAWTRPRLAEGETVVGYGAGDHLMRIRDRDGRGGAVASPFPLRARAEDGRLAPVDMALEERADGFRARNAPSDVLVPKDPSMLMRLGDAQIGVRPALTDAPSSGVEQAGKVFWSDVAPDTDFMVAPLPSAGGAIGTFHVLRSQDAPERLGMVMDLPAGASLRYAAAPALQIGADLRPGDVGVEVVRDGDVIGTISPVRTVDADGEAVPSRLVVDGDRVVVEVEHRAADIKYPAVADPVFVGYVRDDNTWRSGYGSFAGWQYSESPAGYFIKLAGNGAWGNGLYVGAVANAPYCCGYWGQWTYYGGRQSFCVSGWCDDK